MTTLDHESIIKSISETYHCSAVDAKALLGKWEHRRGGPSARFSWLLEELETRFPDAHSSYSSAPPEPSYLREIDQLLQLRDVAGQLLGQLDASHAALEDPGLLDLRLRLAQALQPVDPSADSEADR